MRAGSWHGTGNRSVRPVRVGVTVATVSAAVVAAGQWLGRTAGSTRAERRRVLQGDELVADPTLVTTHATTIAAPPERIWPWLVQAGWHRGGWYTARWVDRLLFPANWPSADAIIPALQHPLVAGDRIPDGPPGTACFVVEHAEAPRLLVLHSTTHVPASWRERLGTALDFDWLWTFALDPTPDGGTRLLLRTRARTAPWWFTAAYQATLVPADFVMARSMFHGLRTRVAPRRATRPAGPPPGAAGRAARAGPGSRARRPRALEAAPRPGCSPARRRPGGPRRAR